MGESIMENTNLNIGHQGKLIVTTEEDANNIKRPPMLPHNSWCTGEDSYHGLSGFPDLKQVWQSISKQGMWIWWELLYNRNYHTNIAKYVVTDRAAGRRLTKAYKELSKLCFIHRVRKQVYLFNPRVVLPERDNFDKVAEHWDFLKLQEKINKQNKDEKS